MNENWKAKTNYFYYNSTVFLVFVYLSSCPEIRVNLEKRKINVVSREIQINSNHFLSLKHKTDLGPMTYLGPMMSSGPRSLSNFPKRYLHIDIPHPFQTSFLVLSGTKKWHTIPQTYKTKRHKYLSKSHDVKRLEWTSWNDVIYYVLLVQSCKLIGKDWEKKAGKVSTRFRACLQMNDKIADIKANAYFK